MRATERDNLELWKSVFKTDERFTTAFSVNGGGTSINGTYMTMMATREFGPKGQGWGVDILEERLIQARQLPALSRVPMAITRGN